MFSEPLLDEFQGSATAREDILSGFCPLRELDVFFPLLCGFLEAYCRGIFNDMRYM